MAIRTINQKRILHDIPLYLFPVYEHDITKEVCRQTYKFRYLFNDSVKSKLFLEESNDLSEWKIEIKEILNELKSLGKSAAENEILRIAKDRY